MPVYSVEIPLWVNLGEVSKVSCHLNMLKIDSLPQAHFI